MDKIASHEGAIVNAQLAPFKAKTGKTLTLTQWSEESGIQAPTIRHRLKMGWGADRAVTQAVANG